ncbi:conserved hypothetical protein [Trichinella spiralis]|uniref:hypothetical protein n=1 Tax=Trichinella spiralis TaxID=6334 RepID=UPI0001EFD1E1|nr:conserved hypothetical protein [Trichinella spiralis]
MASFDQKRDSNKESFHASTKDNRSFLGLLLLSGYHCLADAKYHLTTEPDLTEDGTVELTRLHDDFCRHFLELRALAKDVGANLSGFHALLPMITRKLSPDTLKARRSFVQDLTDEQITSSGSLRRESGSRRLPSKWIRSETVRSAVEFIPLRVSCDWSTSPCRNNGSVSENMACILGVFKKDTVEGAVSKLMIDQVSILCLPRRTPTVFRIADEHRGQHLREVKDKRRNRMQLIRRRSQQSRPLRVLNQRMGLLTESRLNSLQWASTSPRLFGTSVSSCLSFERWLTLRGTPSVVTVRGVHSLSTRVANSRHVRFQLGPVHEETAASMKFELTALCILSICDDLVASLTPWPREIDRMAGKMLRSPGEGLSADAAGQSAVGHVRRRPGDKLRRSRRDPTTGPQAD